MYSDGEKVEPVIHIFTTLPELRYELKTNRFPALTPAQVEVRDPSAKPLAKRKHMFNSGGSLRGRCAMLLKLGSGMP